MLYAKHIDGRLYPCRIDGRHVVSLAGEVSRVVKIVADTEFEAAEARLLGYRTETRTKDDVDKPV